MWFSRFSTVLLVLFTSSWAVSAARKDTPAEFPTFGFVVSPPAGWEPLKKLTESYAGGWIEPEIAGSKSKAAIVIEMQPTENDTLRTCTDRLLKNAGGKYTEASIKLDGIPASRVKFSGVGTGVKARDAVMCLRDRYAYMVGLFADDEQKLDSEMDRIITSWKWTPFDPPASHLDLGIEPIQLCGKAISIKAPSIMRQFAPEETLHEKLFINDARTHVLAIIMDVQIIPKLPEMSLIQLRERFDAGATQKLKLEHPLSWKTVKSPIAFQLTDEFEAPKPHPEGERRVFVRYGLGKISEDRIGLFTFTLTGQSDDDRKLYNSAINRMVESVSVTGKQR